MLDLSLDLDRSNNHSCRRAHGERGCAQQIVGRERRERVSQLTWCGGRCFDSRRRVNSTVRRLVMFLINRTLIVVALSLMGGVFAFAVPDECRKFDEYSDVYCEDQQARLDNFAVALEKLPNATACIIVYGGGTKYRGGPDPRRWEARARSDAIRDYLVNTRGIRTERILTIDGGFRSKWTVQLYVCPVAATRPTPSPTVSAKDIRFKRKPNRAGHYGTFCG